MIFTGDARLAKREQYFTFCGTFEDLMQAHIGEPEVAFMIYGESVGHDEASFTPSAEQFATCAVDDAYRWQRDRILWEWIRPLAAAAVKYKHSIVRINTNTSAQTEDMIFGQLWPIDDNFMLRQREYCRSMKTEEDRGKEAHLTTYGRTYTFTSMA